MGLDVTDLSFSYGDHRVLDGVGFHAGPGELIAVLGPNGVGKSTMFRCILGFEQGFSGRVEVDGRDARQLSRRELASAIAYIPQSSDQVFDYTVLELALMGASVRTGLLSAPSRAEEGEVMRVLAQLGIAHLANRGCGQVSGGEYQLVLLARALVQRSRILIMDEPTANLDFGNQFRVMEHVGALVREGYTVIVSVHDPNLVLGHATRVLVLEGGRMVADGAPADVMTESALSELYGIPVRRGLVDAGGCSRYVCVPEVGARERGDVGLSRGSR